MDRRQSTADIVMGLVGFRPNKATQKGRKGRKQKALAPSAALESLQQGSVNGDSGRAPAARVITAYQTGKTAPSGARYQLQPPAGCAGANLWQRAVFCHRKGAHSL
ncbi:hypothetical protein GGTG_01754 [Gaeumannomyces tritici R3-111a-1]|uniref:Uncharacterized protein n=1 Tax=Gaeumannomyces tritici (strain R3-111a-1) TaxID=644352 RepID=J3NKG5_GAET3|nr:hypothetical protein GGTG_01754 [Gaeumannomyces tritici R3-111a-1]EJT81779.1 hypothetical protein GGTG_01754 [Gaeumannomyces tritici R3-111a-1]